MPTSAEEDCGPWCAECGRGIDGPDHRPAFKLEGECAYCRQRAATGKVTRTGEAE